MMGGSSEKEFWSTDKLLASLATMDRYDAAKIDNKSWQNLCEKLRESGDTILTYAMKQKCKSNLIGKFLNADMSMLEKVGDNPSAYDYLLCESEDRKNQLLDYFVCHAIANKFTKEAKVLLQMCFDRNFRLQEIEYITGNWRDTFIRLAIRNDNFEILDLLINHCKEFQEKPSLIENLMYACEQQAFGCIKLLVEHGAPINERPNFDSAFMVAIKSNNKEIISYLLKKGGRVLENSDETLELFAAAQLPSADIMELFLSYCEENAKNFNEYNKLANVFFSVMCRYGYNLAFAEKLIKQGATVHYYKTNHLHNICWRINNSSSHSLTEEQGLAFIKLLMKYNADPTNGYDKTAFDVLLERKAWICVDYLLDHKVRFGSGLTLTTICKLIEEKQLPTHILKRMLEKGFDPCMVDIYAAGRLLHEYYCDGKKTPLDYVHENDWKNETIILDYMRVLIAYLADNNKIEALEKFIYACPKYTQKLDFNLFSKKQCEVLASLNIDQCIEIVNPGIASAFNKLKHAHNGVLLERALMLNHPIGNLLNHLTNAYQSEGPDRIYLSDETAKALSNLSLKVDQDIRLLDQLKATLSPLTKEELQILEPLCSDLEFAVYGGVLQEKEFNKHKGIQASLKANPSCLFGQVQNTLNVVMPTVEIKHL